MRPLALVVLPALLLVSLGNGAEPDEKDWSTIKGQVVFAGDKIPEKVERKVDKDEKHCGKIYSEEWVVNPTNKGLKNVFVWLVPEPGGDVKALPIHPSLREIKDKYVAMAAVKCVLVPHALGMRKGQILKFTNDDAPIAHNFNTNAPQKSPARSLLLPPKSSVELDNLWAGEFPWSASCNLHPWMKAWIWVFDHPYFAVTDDDGNFEIKLAPAGKWRLRAWHNDGYRGGKDGKAGQAIEVKGGGVTNLGKLEWKPN